MSYFNRAVAVDEFETVLLASLSGPTIGSCTKLKVRTAGGAMLLERDVPAGIRLRMGAWGDRQFQVAFIDAAEQFEVNGVDGYVPLRVVGNDGEIVDRGLLFGSWCAFGDEGLFVPRDHNGRVEVLDMDGTVLRVTQMAPSSSGILRIHQDGRIIVDDPVANMQTTLDGVQVFDAVVFLDGAVVGRVDRRWAMPPVPFVQDDHGRRMCPNLELDLPIDWLREGRFYMAATGIDTPEPEFWEYDSEPYRPADPPPPPPPLPEIVVGPQRAIWRGSLSGVVRGNIGNEPDAARYVEDARFVNTPEQEGRLVSLFIDTKQRDEAKTLAIALRNPVSIILDDDGDFATRDDIDSRLVSGGVPESRILEAHQFYPAPGQSREAFREWMWSNSLLYDVVIRPGYMLNGKLTERQVCEANLDIDNFIAANPNIKVDLSFGLDRDSSPWLKEHFRQLCAATPTPSVSLRQPVQPQQPTKPPQPGRGSVNTKPTKPKPSGLDWTALARAIAKLFRRR